MFGESHEGVNCILFQEPLVRRTLATVGGGHFFAALVAVAECHSRECFDPSATARPREFFRAVPILLCESAMEWRPKLRQKQAPND